MLHARGVARDIHRQVVHAWHIPGIREGVQTVTVVVDAVASNERIWRAVDGQQQGPRAPIRDRVLTVTAPSFGRIQSVVSRRTGQIGLTF
jgi:hypothetical protein